MAYKTIGFTDNEIVRMPNLALLREYIDAKDKELVSLLCSRSVHGGNLESYQPNLDLKLRELGVDDVSAATILHPIYKRLFESKLFKNNAQYLLGCAPQEDSTPYALEKIATSDKALQDAVWERFLVGEPIAKWKFYHTNSEEVTDNNREAQVLENIAREAAQYNLEEEIVKNIFADVIFKLTKGVEHCVMRKLRASHSSYGKVLSITACKDVIPVLERQLREQQGPNSRFKAKEMHENGIKVYGIYMIED